MNHMSKILRWFWNHKKFSAVLVLVLIAVGIFVFRQNGNGKLDEAVVARGDVAEEMVLSGVISAEEHAKLSFPISGRLAWVGAEEGQVVSKGARLMSLDSQALISSYNRAQSDLRAADANVAAVYDSLQGKDKTETFAETNTRTAAEAAKDKAYELYLTAKQNLQDSTLIAPFGGIVTFVANPFSGVNVVATTTQVEIVNPGTIYFKVAADQSEIVDIREGDRVRVILDATDEEIFGVVSRTSYTTVPGEVGSVYAVKIGFEDSLRRDFIYRIGMTGDAHFILKENKNVLYVPSDFVKSDATGDYLLVNGGKEKTYVTVGLAGEERTEIVDGVAEGVLIYD